MKDIVIVFGLTTGFVGTVVPTANTPTLLTVGGCNGPSVSRLV